MRCNFTNTDIKRHCACMNNETLKMNQCRENKESVVICVISLQITNKKDIAFVRHNQAIKKILCIEK